MLGITIFMRWDYNPFGDQVFVLLQLIIFALGDLMQYFFTFIASIKINVAGFQWRGLWVTKMIEGTVDDDVAAKLAIGEGRQADLEQERLELQALNSERFRHRFLERNRPWILQHLVELLTPESLEQVGPDGRPVVDYVRDVYAELMGMGEGARRPGDRSDVSSDDEEDNSGTRDWPRAPLQGASLQIARLWLSKARKRRAFWKLVTGIVEANKKDVCAVCNRDSSKGVKMLVTLATDGKSDAFAIDRLIGMFEQTYSVNEKDANLWRAFFRAHAEFITRCEKCVSSLEQARLARELRRPGAGPKTRPGDISSEGSDDDEVQFDPMVVVRDSDEGKMMDKWLQAARRRLGGMFPRPEARKSMERYAEKMRQRKLKGGKKKIAGEVLREEEMDQAAEKWIVKVNAASSAIAQRWLRKAQDSLTAKFKGKGDQLRTDVERTVNAMPAEDDWFFGAALREEGQALHEKGEMLFQDQRTIEAEEAVKVRRIEHDFENFQAEKMEEIDQSRRDFEAKIAADQDRLTGAIETRTRELQRNKEDKRQEFEETERKAREEEGAASTAMIDDHRKQLDEMDDLIRTTQQRMEKERAEQEAAERQFFGQSERLATQVVTDRKIAAVTNIRRIRKEAVNKIKMAETTWQSNASRWLYTAKRKVDLKQAEDAEAAAAKRRKKRR
jgi:hypothetical protein